MFAIQKLKKKKNHRFVFLRLVLIRKNVAEKVHVIYFHDWFLFGKFSGI